MTPSPAIGGYVKGPGHTGRIPAALAKARLGSHSSCQAARSASQSASLSGTTARSSTARPYQKAWCPTGAAAPDGTSRAHAGHVSPHTRRSTCRPSELDSVLAEFRRLLKPSGVLLAGFFDSDDDVTQFDHKVIAAYRWPADAFAACLAKA